MTTEQLAAYVAGDLDGDERAEVEAALARDSQLRAHARRLRTIDDTLAGMAEVAPPATFRARLDGALRDEFATEEPHDELAARRAARSRWLPRVGIAAAAAAVVGIAAVSIGQLGGGDGAGTAASEPAGAEDAPVAIVTTDADYDAATIGDELPYDLRRDQMTFDAAATEAATEAPPAAPGGDAPPEVAAGTGNGAATAVEPDASESGEVFAGGPEQTEAQAPAPAAPRTTESRLSAELSLGDAEDAAAYVASEDTRIGECLATITAGATTPLVPRYIEVASYEGTPAFIYVIQTSDPTRGDFGRLEVYALAREDCFPLLYAPFRTG